MSDEADKQALADDVVAQALAEAQAELSSMQDTADAANPAGASQRGLELLGDVDLDGAW